jgi:carboxymethylenebutenolidase
MCDERTARENEVYLLRGGMSRREFGVGVSGAMLATLLPPVANAVDIVSAEVLVDTPDGQADCYLAHPAAGRHAAVIMWPDIMGMRPAFRMMGERLAGAGYTVLVVNPYYRTAKGEVIKEGEGFHIPEVRERLMPLAQTLSPETCVTDGKAFVSYLDANAAVDASRQMGTAGYCMTGSYTLRLAAAVPERIGAGASFHGGRLVTDAADSPHRLVPQMDAGFLIAIAENDDQKDPDAKGALRDAFDAAELAAEIEVYAGAMHGWCPPDSRVYNQEQAERAWARMLALFGRELS